MQAVVATTMTGRLRGTGGSGDRIGLGGRPCPPQVVRRWRAGISRDSSGRPLRWACRVKRLVQPPVSRKRLERDGSGRPAACHQRCSGPHRSRCLAAPSRLRNAKRSRSCERKAAPCRTLPAGSGERRRRSPARCSATPPPAVAASRALRRNAATRSGGLEYRATTAQWHAERSARRPKQAKLAVSPTLRTYVQERLAGLVIAPGGAPVPGPTVSWKGRRHGRRQDRRWARAWRPEQIARRLPIDFPDDEAMRISHEAIYQALFVQGRGALRRELTACLRTGRVLRMPRARTRGRGQTFIVAGCSIMPILAET